MKLTTHTVARIGNHTRTPATRYRRRFHFLALPVPFMVETSLANAYSVEHGLICHPETDLEAGLSAVAGVIVSIWVAGASGEEVAVSVGVPVEVSP